MWWGEGIPRKICTHTLPGDPVPYWVQAFSTDVTVHAVTIYSRNGGFYAGGSYINLLGETTKILQGCPLDSIRHWLVGLPAPRISCCMHCFQIGHMI